MRRLLPVSAARPRMLDIGCGYGFFSAEALRQGFGVTAIELASEERAVARELTGLVPVDESFEDFQAPSGSFDAILMSQILEHARDVNAWIEKTRDLLVPGGVLAVALPNFGSIFRRIAQERDVYITPPAHLNFFEAGSLERLLKKHGFRIAERGWVSRMPRSALEKRLGNLGAPAVTIAHATVRAMLGGFDRMRLGMIVNVIAIR